MKSSVNFTSAANLAKLANLQLTPAMETALKNTLPDILSFVDQIKELDLSKVEETSRTGDEENILRKDVIKKSFTTSESLQNASRTYNGYFVVSQVLHKE